MADHNELGKQGEQLALQHLLKKGYQLLEKNWRFGRDEIDIIMQEGDELVIVEVKTRENNYMGEPEEAVTRSKQKRIIQAAHAYVEDQSLDLDVRFDVVGIIINSKKTEINHIKDAFQPRW